MDIGDITMSCYSGSIDGGVVPCECQWMTWYVEGSVPLVNVSASVILAVLLYMQGQCPHNALLNIDFQKPIPI